MHDKYVRDLVADDAAITTHTQEDLQWLLDRFSKACRHFGLTISLAKTQVMGHDIKEIPSLFIHNYKLEVVHEFVYLGSTITWQDKVTYKVVLDKAGIPSLYTLLKPRRM